jgi:hypothetical protein
VPAETLPNQAFDAVAIHGFAHDALGNREPEAGMSYIIIAGQQCQIVVPGLAVCGAKYSLELCGLH